MPFSANQKKWSPGHVNAVDEKNAMARNQLSVTSVAEKDNRCLTRSSDSVVESNTR